MFIINISLLSVPISFKVRLTCFDHLNVYSKLNVNEKKKLCCILSSWNIVQWNCFVELGTNGKFVGKSQEIGINPRLPHVKHKENGELLEGETRKGRVPSNRRIHGESIYFQLFLNNNLRTTRKKIFYHTLCV